MINALDIFYKCCALQKKESVTRMEFAAPTRKAPMAMMADSRGASGMELDTVQMDATKTTPWERRFNPYDFNGGRCGDDFC